MKNMKATLRKCLGFFFHFHFHFFQDRTNQVEQKKQHLLGRGNKPQHAVYLTVNFDNLIFLPNPSGLFVKCHSQSFSGLYLFQVDSVRSRS